MTNPINRNQNINLNFTISVPEGIPMQVQNTYTDSLRMNQSAQEGFSFKSICDAITNFFKSLFSCFFTTSHSSNRPKDEIARIAAKDQFIWFYKKEENQLTAFLGNFHPCPIRIWGLQFQCAEAAFQAAKFAPDRNTMAGFQNLDGQAAFTLGRQLTHNWSGARTRQWRNRSLDVMREVLREKFNQNPDLEDLLLATGNAYLVEHIPVKDRDGFWGDDSDGTGKNWLGKIAMEVRGVLGGTGAVLRNQQYNQFLGRR